jgi:alpha-1,3-glucan synthase
MYLLDGRSDNYIFGRQPMTSSLAWQLHGCFQRNASYQYFQMPFNRTKRGCEDNAQSRDHFNVATPEFSFVKHLYHLYNDYPVLRDGFSLRMLSQNTWNVTVQTSDYVTNYTVAGVWSAVRSFLPQQKRPAGNIADTAWFVYSNANHSTSWSAACDSPNAIRSPFITGTQLINIFPPFDTVRVGGQGYQTCLEKVDLKPFEFKVFVELSKWIRPGPMIGRFEPGHDARIARPDDVEQGKMSVPFSIYFTERMDCQSVISSIFADSGNLRSGSLTCQDVFVEMGQEVTPAVWALSGTLENVSDGVHRIIVGKNARGLITGRAIQVSLVVQKSNLVPNKYINRRTRFS